MEIRVGTIPSGVTLFEDDFNVRVARQRLQVQYHRVVPAAYLLQWLSVEMPRRLKVNPTAFGENA